MVDVQHGTCCASSWPTFVFADLSQPFFTVTHL